MNDVAPAVIVVSLPELFCSTRPVPVSPVIMPMPLNELVAHDTTITAGATSFMFTTPVLSGATFNVSVRTQSIGPNQVCTPSANMGMVGNGDVMGVLITCTPTLYTVSARVIGLTGSGLQLQANGAATLALPGNNMPRPFAMRLSRAPTFNVS